MEIGYLIFGILIVCLAIGVPIAFSLGIATLCGLYFMTDIPLSYLGQTAYTGCDLFPVIAVPAFILAGFIMQKGEISEKITNIAIELIGPLPGGMAIVNIISCMFFASVSGSGPATVAAVGSVMIPAMEKENYPSDFSAAVTSSGGTIGILIPPSNPMIIYGVVGNVSIASMFIGGMIPGLIVGLVLAAVAFMISKRNHYGGIKREYSLKRLIHRLNEGKWAILAPLIILGGIYAGLFTPVEASIVAVAYAFFLGLVIHRTLSFKDIYDSLVNTSLISGTVLIIFGPALAFGRLLTMYEIPQTFALAITSISTEWFIVFMIINLFFIFVGTFMETLSAIVLLTPIFLPIMKELGVDPIHFGMLIVVTSEIGFLTPPLGVNLFVACGITGLTLEQVSKRIIPFIIALFICVVIFTAFPWFSTFLPNLLMR